MSYLRQAKTRIDSMYPDDILDELNQLSKKNIKKGKISPEQRAFLTIAADHDIDEVALKALEKISFFDDKTEFAPFLSIVAKNHRNVPRARWAFLSIGSEPALTPYISCLYMGIHSENDEIALMAIGAVERYAKKNKMIHQALDHMVEIGLKCSNNYIFSKSFSVLEALKDKSRLTDVLAELSMDHSNIERAQSAFKVMMEMPQHIGEFFSAINKAVKSNHSELVYLAGEVIYCATLSQKRIPSQYEMVVREMLKHSNEGAVRTALLIVEQLKEKKPFEQDLIALGSDYSRPYLANAAIEALYGATDFTPYYAVLDKAMRNYASDVHFAAVYILCEHRELFNAPQLEDSIVDALNHMNNRDDVSKLIKEVATVNNPKRFIEPLKRLAREHPSKYIKLVAKESLHACILRFIEDKRPVGAEETYVRLDFNIKANGVDLSRHLQTQVADLLENEFRKSALGGLILSTAKVFYCPQKPDRENETIDVVFEETDANEIARRSLQGAPEFKMRPCFDGSYSIELK